MTRLPAALQQRASLHFHLVDELARSLLARLPPGTDIDDVSQCGFIGLLEADQQYEGPAEGFPKYSRARIRASMLNELPDKSLGSRRLQRMVRRLRKRARGLEQSLGRPPRAVEFADAGGLTLEAYQNFVREKYVLRKDPGTAAMNRSIDLHEGIFGDPLHSALKLNETKCLNKALRKLPHRERKMLRMHYSEGLKLKTIGNLFGITESRVSQIMNRALARLRDRLAS